MQTQQHESDHKMIMDRKKRVRLKRIVACGHIGVAVCTLSTSICTAIFVYKPDPRIVPLTLAVMLLGSVIYLALCVFDYLLVSGAKHDDSVCICRKSPSYYSGC